MSNVDVVLPQGSQQIMITIEQARKIDPSLAGMPDTELEAILHEQEEMATLALECYMRFGSNIPDGLLPTEHKKG